MYLRRYSSSLPVRSFYSTPKKTYILALQHKSDDGVEQLTLVFSYLVSEIGETRDANRWAVDENHLHEMVSLFNQFKGAPDTFKSPCARCKVVPWKAFTTYEHWMVDRYWSRDEFVELGLIQEPATLSIADFSRLVVQAGGEGLDGTSIEAAYAKVPLNDRTLFTLQVGTRVKKIRCVDEGIPCISSNVNDVFGYIKKSNLITDFRIPSITWGLDGDFDWYLIPSDHPFHPTDHCGVLRIMSPDLDPEYVYHSLRATRDRYGFDRTYRANLDHMKWVFVDVPVRQDGTFDLDMQRKMAVRYREIEDRRVSVKRTLQQIVDARVVLS